MKKIYAYCIVLVINTGLVFSQWAYLDRPQLNDVCFAKGSNTAYAVGKVGLVLKSTNGGSSWTELPFPTRGNGDVELKKVVFPSPLTGYVLAFTNWNNIEIYKTTNGGNTWTKLQKEFHTGDYFPLYMVSNDTGFIVCNTMYYSEEKGIYRTTDGGQTWQKVYNNPTSFYIRSVAFVSPSNGFAVRDKGVILKTTDAGQTWLKDSLPTLSSFTDIYFVDATTGYISAKTGQMMGEIYKTTNGGVNWNVEQVLPFSVSRLAFWGASNGIALRDDYSGGGYFKYNGSAWTLDTLKGTKTLTAVATAASYGVLIGDNSLIAYTTNAGSSWNILNIAPSVVSAVGFSGPGTGYMIGAEYYTYDILKTTDGGATFQVAYSKSDIGTPGIKIQFFGSTGYAVFSGKIFKTTDGGNAWNATSPVPTITISGVSFANANLGFINGLSGDNYITTDGGVTFRNKSNFPLSFKEAEFVPGSNNVIMAITDNKIYQTTDTGTILNVVGGMFNYGDTTYTDLFALNINTMYVCGKVGWGQGEGIILKGTAMGTVWTKINLGISVPGLNAIRFSDASNGYAVGNNGTIIKTMDGGNTWTKVPLMTSEDLKDIVYDGASWYVVTVANELMKLVPLNVSPSQLLSIGYTQGSTATVNLTGTGSWNAFVNKPYYSLNKTSGNAPDNIILTATKSLLKERDTSDVLYVAVPVGTSVVRNVPVAMIKVKHEYFCIEADTMKIDTLFLPSSPYNEDSQVYLHVYSSSPYTVSENIPWLTVNNQYELIVSYQKNDSAMTRQGVINFNTQSLGLQTLRVIQGGAQVRFSTNEASFTMPQEGGKDTLYITSNTRWTLKTSHPWVSLSKTSGAGNGMVVVTVLSNTLSWQRVALINIFAEGWVPYSIPVMQEGTGSGQGTCTHQAIILNPPADTLCVGDSVLLTANPGTGYLYQWFIDGISVLSGMNNTLMCRKAGSYMVSVTYNNCTVLSSVVKVNYYPPVPIPEIEIKSGSLVPCMGGSIDLQTRQTYAAYKWSTGETTPVISVTKSGHYQVEVTDEKGCKAKAADFEVNASMAKTPEICLVNVDRLENKNAVIWKRAAGEKIKSYVLYKETTKAGEYLPQDTIPYNEYNIYVDPNSNPDIRSNRYRITAIDSCDFESPASVVHKTMHLTLNQRYGGGVNLIWENYEGLPISSYIIYHGDSPATMEPLVDVPSNIFTYTILDNLKRYYQIAIQLPEVCDITRPLKAESGPYAQSLSNIAEFKALALQEVQTGSLSAYPNPFTDKVNIHYTLQRPSEVRFEVINAVGQKTGEISLALQDAGQYTYTLDAVRMNMTPGLYLIRMIVGNQVETLKVECR